MWREIARLYFPAGEEKKMMMIKCLLNELSWDRLSGLEISAHPLAKASVKTVRRVQITDHSPGLASTIFISTISYILFKISVIFFFTLNNLHCPQANSLPTF